MISLYINLPAEVASALAKLARSEQRSPRDQVAFMLKRDLKIRGLLPAPNTDNTPPANQPRELAREM